MRPDLPKPGCRRAGLRKVLLAWLIAVACLGGHRALAEAVAAGDEPPVKDAVVEMDAEVNTWLARAAAAMRAGSPDTALPLLLHVLQSVPDAMASTNGVTYQPARKLAVRLIRALPEKTIAAYRRRADVSALESFRSGLPDAASMEAGQRLAGFYLDQERFREGRRVLLNMLDEGPVARAQRSELLARLVVACARVGDTTQAQWAWAELQKLGDTNRWASLGAELRPPAASAAPEGACPPPAADDSWVIDWGLNLGPGVIRGGPDSASSTNLPQWSMSRSSAAARMTERNSRPADDVVLAGNRAWVNSFDEIVAVDLDAGRVIQRTARIPDPTPAGWAGGGAIRINFGMGGWMGGFSSGSLGPADSWVFGNRLNRAASLIGGRVYCVEDNHRASLDKNMRERQVQVGNKWVMRPQPCGNALAAYEAGTARRLWRIGRETPPTSEENVVEDGFVWDVPFVDGIVVDGNLDDWRGRGVDISLTSDGDGGGRAWPGATVGLAWNDAGLAVRANVIDADIQEVEAVSNIWQGDSIEMFLADRRGGPNCIQVAAGTGADPLYKETRFHIFDRRKAPAGRANAAPEAAVAGRPAPRGYRFEALLPWINLGIRPRSGSEAAFQLYVNNTASNRPAMAARFYPKTGTFSDTRLMYTLRLADAYPGAPAPQPQEEPVKERSRWVANAIRFAAAPVPCAGLLIAPVEEDSGFCVVGLDADSGVTVWHTRLAYGGVLSAPRVAPVAVAIEGVYAYLCTGNGAVSALDGCDGSVLWTTLYEPIGGAFATNSAAGAAPPDANWEQSLALVAGGTVVALPEDSGELLAFDRWNGTRLWTRRKPEGVDYVVGKRGAALIVAGGRTVASVDLADGRERWRTPIEGSTGRGALCGEYVLIPRGRTILRLRAEDGKSAGSAPARTMDGLPLGNLYVNGGQLLVAGLERLYALVDAKPAFARLAERLAKDPTAEAYAERSRLYVEIGRYADALADLRDAWKRQRGSAEEEAARARLLAEMESAPAQDSGAAEALYAAAVQVTNQASVNWRLAQYRERVGDTNGALALYAAIFTAPDAPISPTMGDANWEVLAHRLAAQRIRALLAGPPAAPGAQPLRAGDEARGLALLEEPAAQALARLGPTPACTALVEVATFFPGTAAGREAAFKAAQLAAGRGDLGTADAILQRALALSTPSNRVAVAEAMVRLYERMKWPKGALQLHDEWSRLGGGTPEPEFLERAPAAQREAAAISPPPWRLRWRKALPAGATAWLLPSGLLYWSQSAQQMGCLDAETGLPRWQTAIALTRPLNIRSGAREAIHFVALSDDGRVWVDLWSGAILTNGLLRSTPERTYAETTVNRMGLATVSSQEPGGVLASMDLLTGRAIWRRGEMDALTGNGTIPQLLLNSPDGIMMRAGADSVVVLDLWTGGIASRRSVDSRTGWARFAGGPGGWSTRNADAPVLAEQKLTVKNSQTGVTVWTTPPDLAIVKYQAMPNGIVLAQTDAEELLLLDGEDGKILRRTEKTRFTFDYATQSESSDAVITFRRREGGTNEVLVLDPAVNRIAFQGRLPPQMQPLLSLGPAMPDKLLVSGQAMIKVKDRDVYQPFIRVVNAQAENTSGWRLPRVEDLRDANGSYNYAPYFAGKLILMVDRNQASGDVLAYEHDSGDGAKKP